MTNVASQVSTFLDNIAISSTNRSVRSGSSLVPVGETPPRMWSVDAVWTPFADSEVTTRSGGARSTDQCVTAAQKQNAVRRALSSLLVLIAAKTVDHSPGTPIDSKETARWCNFIVTWARLIFTQPLEHVGRGAVDTPLLSPLAKDLIDWHDEVVETGTQAPGCQTLLQLRDLGRARCQTFGFPALNDFDLDDIRKVVRRDFPKEEPAYYAMVVYMSGRALTGKTENAVRTTRPANLQQKFNEGGVWESIGGTIAMSRGAYTQIAKAWQMNTTMRIGLLVPLIQLDAGEAYVTGNIVYTVFKLLRGAGMAHVGIIAAFLRKYPYAAELPEIRSEIYYLALHSKSLRTVPSQIQPYYKLLYSDAAGLFDSKVLTRLTSLAVIILGRDTNTLLAYAHATDQVVESAFDELCEQKRQLGEE